MHIEAQVYVHEVDGETTGIPAPKVTVESNGRNCNRIVLVVDGKRYGIAASDLQEAVKRCSYVP